MAGTEVGTAWVTIVPSAKGFARQLQKDIAKEFAGSKLDRMIADALGDVRVSIPVSAELDPRDLRDDLTRVSRRLDGQARAVEVPVTADADDLADQITAVVVAAEAIVRAEIPTVPTGAAEYARDLRAVVDQAEARVLATIPTDADTSGVLAEVARVADEAERTNDIDLSVDVDQRRIAGLGGSVGRTMSDGVERTLLDQLPRAVSGPLNAVANNPVISSAGIVVGAFVGLALASAISASIAGAITGGVGLGVIGLGAVILKEEPLVAQAARGLMSRVQRVFSEAAEPLIMPFVRAMDILDETLVRIQPQLEEMFAAIAPAVEPLAEAFAGFIEGALPGLIELTRQAVPLLTDLASTAPRLGEDFGAFLSIISDAGPGASLVIRDLLNLVGLALIGTAHLIAALSQQYEDFRGMTVAVVDAVAAASRTGERALESLGATAVRIRDFISGAWRAARADTDGFISFVTGIPGRILRAVGPDRLASLLEGAGRALIRGLIRGIQDMLGPLGSTLGRVTNFIAEHKGPPERDRVLLEPAGRAIMGGLIRGIHGERSALQAELGSVTSVIAGTPLTSPALAGGYGVTTATAAAAPMLAWAPGATGDALLDAIRELIRIRWGGDPDAALGSV